MFDFHEKRKIRSVLYSKTTIGVLLLIAIALSFSVYERYSVERTVSAKRAEREADLLRLKERAEMLEGKIEYLQSERGMEEELRNRYDVAKEGEQVIIIVDTPTPAAARTVPAARAESEDEGFLESLKFWQ